MTPGHKNTADVIASLAVAPVPRTWRPDMVATVLLVTVGLGVAVYLWMMGLRPGLGASLKDPVTLAKVVLPLMVMGLALPAAVRLARPEERPALWPLALPLVAGLALVAVVAAATPVAAVGTAVMGGTIVKCLTSILGLSALPLAVALALVRQGAPTRPVLAGALCGLSVGAGAAAGYALGCAEDSPLFFVTWYGAAIGIVSAAGAVGGKAALRW